MMKAGVRYLESFALTVCLLSFADCRVVAGVPGPAQLLEGANDLAAICVGKHDEPAEQRVVFCSRAIDSTAFHNDSWPYFGRAAAYLDEEKFALALADLDIALGKAVSKDPNVPSMYDLRCYLRARTGAPLDQALSDCNLSLTARPGHVQTLRNRAYVEFKMMNFAAVVRDTSLALATEPRDARSLYLRGLAEKVLGQAQAGDKDLAAASAIEPNAARLESGVR